MFLALLFLFSMCISSAHAESPFYKQNDIIDICGQKAIVFLVDENGEHGTAMCIKAFRGVDKPWCNNGKLLKNIPDMTNEENGEKNTQSIVAYARKQNILSNFPVYNWCVQLGDRWYIPSLKELESFINYWLGNDRVFDWDDEQTEDIDQPYYKIVNEKILNAGGTPFNSNVYTSTIDKNGNVHYFKFYRFYKRESMNNSWSIQQEKINNLNENFVGRAFIKF